MIYRATRVASTMFLSALSLMPLDQNASAGFAANHPRRA
jgi:hypothetical protein